MSVRLLTHSNQDASYVQAAAIGAATGYLAKRVLPLSTQEQRILVTNKSLSGNATRKALEGAQNAIKNARPALTYTLVGALAALSALTIANSAKKISDVNEKQAGLDIEA